MSYICLSSFLDLETFSFSFLFCQFWFQKILNFDRTFFVKTPARCELSLFWTLIHSWADWAWDAPARVSVFLKLFVHLDSRADSAAQLSLIGIFWFFISQRNLHINNFRKFVCWEKPWIASSAPWITRTWNLRKNRELQSCELRNRELWGSPVASRV